MPIGPRPVVYISYSWVTVKRNELLERVPDPSGPALADDLRAEAVDVRLDIYAREGLHGQRQPLKTPDDTRDPWHAWAMRQVAEADVVLMLCTPDYVQPDCGDPGGAFELWSQLSLDDRIAAHARALWWDWLAIAGACDSRPQKFVPVGHGPYRADFVPGFLRGATYHDLDRPDALESLLRRIRQVWHERTPRSGVFISYAHDDEPMWLDGLLAHLRPLEQIHGLAVWTDRDIMPGDLWHLTIQNALDRAQVGVMLVSPAFLDSDYVRNDELPKMLRNAESEGLKIFWVPIVRTDPKANPITKFQAAHAPDKPLAELGKAKATKAFAAISAKLAQLLEIASVNMARIIGVSVLINPPPSPNCKEAFDEFDRIQSHLESLGVHTEKIDEPKNPDRFPLIEYSPHAADAASALRALLLPILGTYRKSQSSESVDAMLRKRAGSGGRTPRLWLHL